MTVKDLLYETHRPIESLTPLTEELFNQLDTSSIKVKYKDLEKYINHIYIQNYKGGKPRLEDIAYIDTENAIAIETVLLRMTCGSLDKAIKGLEKENLRTKFFHLSGKYALYILNKIYNKLDTKELRECFSSAYTRTDVFAGQLDKALIDKLGYENTKQKGTLKVYRGVGTKSCKIEDCLSWTTNYGTALFFALRSGVGCKVYSADVPKDKIIMDVSDRGEYEVLIKYEDLNNVKEEPMNTYNTMEEILDDLGSGILCRYSDYEDYLLEADRCLDSKLQDHTLNHSKRVFLYSLLYSKYEDLRDSDVEVLSLASIFHDIGRSNDKEDRTHGAMSCRVIEEQGLLDDFDKETQDIVKFIIEYHSKDDKEGIKKAQGNEKKIELLKIFKDMDCLDRCRFGMFRDCFDISYIRTPTARKMLLQAGLLTSYKVENVL